jgi:sentrin-specific protease 7
VFYGKSSSGSIRNSPGAGQRAYLEQLYATTPSRNVPSRQAHAHSDYRAPSAKRRKTKHVVDLVDDDNDDVEVVSQEYALRTPAARPTQAPRPPLSTRSRDSAGSINALSGSQPGHQFQSGFLLTEERLNPRLNRKRNGTPCKISDARGAQSLTSRNGRSMSRSLTPHHQDDFLAIDESDYAGAVESARRNILQDFQQGDLKSAHAARKYSPRKEDETTSRHFPNARINESTSDNKQQRPNALRTNDLRVTHRPVDNGPLDSESHLDDEFGMATPKMKSSAGKGNISPSKTSQAANSGAKRKPRRNPGNKSASQGWPLLYARAHGFEGRGVVENDHGRADLVLRSGSEENEWRVVQFDPNQDLYLDKMYITPRDVIQGVTNDVSRLRLSGSLHGDGNRPIFDLEFAYETDLLVFLNYAERLSVKGKLLKKTEGFMESLFNIALPRNDKVGTTPLVSESVLVEDTNDPAAKLKPSKEPLWSQMKVGAHNRNVASTNSRTTGASSLSVSSRGLARSVRTTRSAAPNYNAVDGSPYREVEKYSIDHGLGDPWTKPLIFGERPHRAVVYFDDLPCIDEEEYLNDSVIDFYLIYLFNKSGISRDKVFYFSTQFYTTLTANTGRLSIDYAAVKNWTSKVDIFAYDYIVVPINEAMHWYLAIICNVGNIPRVPIEEDFGDDTAANHEEAKDDKLISELHPAAAQVLSTSKPAGIIDVSKTPKKDTNEKFCSDANLFDEQETSNLNLIDRDDAGTDGEMLEGAARPHQELEMSQAEAAHNAVISDQETKRTVKSDLKRFLPKKTGKRKPAAPKRNPNQPIIIVLDSLSQGRSNTVRALKDWLAAEGVQHRAIEAVIKENGFYPKAPHIPTQHNYTDCGVYLLGYAEKFFANPDDFKNKLLSGEMSTAEDWPEFNARNMRNNLRDTLFKLADEQQLVKKKVKKSSSPSKAQPSKTKSGQDSPESKPLMKSHPQTQIVEAEEKHPVDTTEQDDQSADQTLVPRLGSPFSPKPQPRNNTTPTKSPALPDKVSSSSPVRMTPARDAAASTHSGVTPKKTNPGIRHSGVTPRRVSPEVRILVKSPRSAAPARSAHAVVMESMRKRETPVRTRLEYTSMSSTKRRVQDADKKPPLTGSPTMKRTIKSPSADRSHFSTRTSPTAPRHREGSSAAPIEIPDSQDVQKLSVASQQRSSPSHRRQPTRAPHILHSLRHDPSVEEIPAPSVRVSPRKHRKSKEGVVGRELEAQLDREDDRMQRSQGPPPSTMVPGTGEEGDAMDVDEGVDEMDVDDDVVRETPEPSGRSPNGEGMDM